MKSSWHKRYTVTNNLNATNNVLAALVEAKSNAHLVHLGTMGVYGYGTAGMKIPEGYLTVKVDTGENLRSEEHTSELQSLMRISYAVFCLKKKKYTKSETTNIRYCNLTSEIENKRI